MLEPRRNLSGLCLYIYLLIGHPVRVKLQVTSDWLFGAIGHFRRLSGHVRKLYEWDRSSGQWLVVVNNFKKFEQHLKCDHLKRNRVSNLCVG